MKRDSDCPIADSEAARQIAWSKVAEAAENALCVVNLRDDDADALRRLLAAADELARRAPRLRPLPRQGSSPAR
jgi:hypothetical protein